MPAEKIIIAADHGGYSLKEALKPRLPELGLDVTDIGTDSDQAVDYPDYGEQAAAAVSAGRFPRGILICGSGVGMSIVANRFPGIRAALCANETVAELSRRHNDANVLVLPGRFLTEEEALRMVKIWSETPFDGGRHQARVEKIDA